MRTSMDFNLGWRFGKLEAGRPDPALPFTGEAIYFGVPMIAIPQMDEQAITAGQIEKNGLGLAFLDKNAITADALRTAILRLLNEPSFRGTARAFSEDMRALGGAQATADAIVRFLKDRSENR